MRQYLLYFQICQECYLKGRIIVAADYGKVAGFVMGFCAHKGDKILRESPFK